MTESLLGSKIGHFRFVDKLGEGGMGEVYAGYDETLQRKVAIKGIRPEFRLDGETRGRFLREARVLSQLGHPNICRIYDYLEGGGSDFIVMELVEGRNLAQALKKGLDDHAKMKIAEQVAGVLVAAHEKGVVHRDLKPDNVMLAEGDLVKVLDFGLSRQLSDEAATGTEETAAAFPDIESAAAPAGDEPHGLPGVPGSKPAASSSWGLTTAGTIMGTLSYMSPEQARGELASAASDMYSFGLVLQELFTGKPAYEPGLKAAARLEKARKGETLPATGIDTDMAALIGRLKSPEPAARPSALDAAEKLAWIGKKPLVRRRRLIMAASIAILAALAMVATVQWVRAVRAEKRAQVEARTAERVSDFMVSIFKVSDPGEARGRTVTAREILDGGAKRVETELEDQPLVQAQLLSAIGTVYANLGLYAEAEPLLKRTLEIRERTLDADHPDLPLAINDLAALYHEQGRYREAVPLYERALDLFEKRLGPDDASTLATLGNLGLCYKDLGDLPKAESMYKRALGSYERTLSPYDPRIATVLNSLAKLYQAKGDYAGAEPLLIRALSIREKELGPDHPDVAVALDSLTSLYRAQRKYAEAEQACKRAMAIREKVLPPDHPDVAVALNNLASLYQEQGNLDEAEVLFKKALAIRERSLGASHPAVASTLNNMAMLYSKQGKSAEAERLLVRAIEIDEKALGPNSPVLARLLSNLADLLRQTGRPAEAASLDERAGAIRQKDGKER